MLTAWLFDVDGVITHPEQKIITEPQILDEIIKLLQKNEPVGLLTGRSLLWLKENVINLLTKRIPNKKILKNLMILAEFGGVQLIFEDGEEKITINQKIVPPQTMVQKAKTLVENEFGKYIFFDPTKKTIITFEINDGLNLSKFKEGQNKLAPKLSKLIKKEELSANFHLHNDRLGVNIRSINSNKSQGVRDFLVWLREKNISVQKFIVFGDSKSDSEMALELSSQKLIFEFVFTGYKNEIANQNLLFPVTFTSSHFEKGTLEYLSKHSV